MDEGRHAVTSIDNLLIDSPASRQIFVSHSNNKLALLGGKEANDCFEWPKDVVPNIPIVDKAAKNTTTVVDEVAYDSTKFFRAIDKNADV